MLELIAAVICCAALCFDAVALLLHRNELKALRVLIPQETPTTVEKSRFNKPRRRATRLTDGSKKWLENRGKRAKEVN